MAFERLWERQDPVAFTADGGQDGLVTVNNVACFKVKQQVVLSSNTQPDIRLQIKKVVSVTQLLVGPDLNAPTIKRTPNTSKNNMHVRQDISAYTVADGATIRAPEQSKSVPKIDDIWKAIYEQEPTVAMRSFLVDKLGRGYDVDNPLSVRLSDGDMHIGTVEANIEVQTTRLDDDPDLNKKHDSMRIGNQGGEVTYSIDDLLSKYLLDVNVGNRTIDKPFKKITVAQKTDDGDPEIVEIRNDAGAVVRTLTLLYDADGDFFDLEKS